MHKTRRLLHVLEGSLPSSLTLKSQSKNSSTLWRLLINWPTSFFLTIFLFLMSIFSSLFSLDSLFYWPWWLPHKHPPSPCSHFCIYFTSEIPTLVKLNSWPLFHTCTRTVDWLETMHDHQTLNWDLRNMLHFLNQWNLQFSETALWPFLFSSQTDYLTVHFT